MTPEYTCFVLPLDNEICVSSFPIVDAKKDQDEIYFFWFQSAKLIVYCITMTIIFVSVLFKER
jgi:hypothetical protein